MALFGVGLDLCDVARMERELSREGYGLRDEVFTAAEIADCEARLDPATNFAARFAAKEAVFKALTGSGSERLGWREVEVVTAGGVPSVVLRGGLSRVAAERDATVTVTLACRRPLAAAWALVSARSGVTGNGTEARR